MVLNAVVIRGKHAFNPYWDIREGRKRHLNRDYIRRIDILIKLTWRHHSVTIKSVASRMNCAGNLVRWLAEPDQRYLTNSEFIWVTSWLSDEPEHHVLLCEGAQTHYWTFSNIITGPYLFIRWSICFFIYVFPCCLIQFCDIFIPHQYCHYSDTDSIG